MGPSLRQLTAMANQCVQSAWTARAKMGMMEGARTAITDTLRASGSDMSTLRAVLEALHIVLQKQHKTDEIDHASLFDALAGALSDCDKFLHRLRLTLQKLQGDDDSSASIRLHMQAFNLELHRPELERSRLQAQGHTLLVGLGLTMLVTHNCADLATRSSPRDPIRHQQLITAYQKLQRLLDRAAMQPILEVYEAASVYKIRDLGKDILRRARAVSSQTPGASTYGDNQSEITVIQDLPFGQSERDLVESWINQLGAVKDDEADLEEYTYSDLPEVSSISPTQEPSNGASRSNDSMSTRQTSDGGAPVGLSLDDYSANLVRGIVAQGKNHYALNNREQALDTFERALVQLKKLSAAGQQRVDVTEIRAMVATLQLQMRRLDAAEHSLRAIVAYAKQDETPENSNHIATAHLQLAQIYLLQRQFDDAHTHCHTALRGRLQLFGHMESPQVVEAMQLQALIFHAEGSHAEAKAVLDMLPAEHADQTRIDMDQQARAGPTFTLFPSSPPPTLSAPPPRPSFSGSERPHFRRPNFGRAPSQERPDTGRRTEHSNGSLVPNSNLPPGVRSQYSNASLGSHLSAPPVRLDRSHSMMATMTTPLPFRQGHLQPGSPHAQGASVFEPAGPKGRKERTVSSPPTNPPQIADMATTSKLEQAGFLQDFDGAKAMAWAIREDQLDVVRYLLDGWVVRPKRRFSREGKDVTRRVNPQGLPKERITPLILASQYGRVLIAETLIQRGAEVTTTSDKRPQPLLVAAEHGSAEMVRLLWTHGARADMMGGRRQWTPFHAAAQAGHHEVVQHFLDHGLVVVDHEDPSGAAALKLAAARGHHLTVQLLLANHAEVDHTDDTGWTALLSSIKHGHTHVAKLLLRADASPDLANHKQQTPLMVAARENRLAETRLVLDHHAHTETADDKKWTPLIAASHYGASEVAQLLIQNGANVNAHCNRNSTALDHALNKKYKDIQYFLKAAGGHTGSGLTEAQTQNTAFTGYAM